MESDPASLIVKPIIRRQTLFGRFGRGGRSDIGGMASGSTRLDGLCQIVKGNFIGWNEALQMACFKEDIWKEWGFSLLTSWGLFCASLMIKSWYDDGGVLPPLQENKKWGLSETEQDSLASSFYSKTKPNKMASLSNQNPTMNGASSKEAKMMMLREYSGEQTGVHALAP